jgi:tetratricopeptide (TPR) repeat protein
MPINPPVPPLTPMRRTWLICLGLLSLTLAVYWPVGRGEFLSVDDHAYISENRVVQAGLTRNSMQWAFADGHVANYHPLTWLSHMLDCQLFGLNAGWHHRVNLLFHASNVILLFLVLRWITARQGCAAFVAALFAVHPQHVESVAWVAERKDVLSGFFWMLTLAAYAWYAERGTWWRYAIALLPFGLGLLSKPTLVTLPCVLLLLDCWPLKRSATWKWLFVEKIPFFAMAGLMSIATVIAQSQDGAVASVEQMSLSFRVGNAIVSYARYARKFFWPTDLAAFYPLLRPWAMGVVTGCAIGLVAVTIAILLLGRRRPYLAVGWLWFLGTLVPMIGIVQVGNQAMADRYMYLPMIGLALVVTWLVAELLPRRRAVLASLAAIVLIACSAVTARDVRYWNNSEALFTRALQLTEPNVFALHNLGTAKLLRNDTNGAIADFAECTRLQPGNPHVRRAWGYALRVAKRYDEAKTQLATAIRINPKDPRSWDAMGNLYGDQNKWREAADHFAVAVELKADEFDSWINLAVAHKHLDENDAAATDLQTALRINPRLAQPWYMLGRLMLESGKPSAAIEPLARATAIEPTHPDAHALLGVALMKAGRGSDALAPLMTALRVNPNSTDVMSHLAWLLATHPDARLRNGDDAMFLASRADALTKSASWEVLDALAAAQAEQGNFDQAVRTADKAAQLARIAGETTLAGKIESRAARYRARSAVRDASLAGTDLGDVTK